MCRLGGAQKGALHAGREPCGRAEGARCDVSALAGRSRGSGDEGRSAKGLGEASCAFRTISRLLIGLTWARRWCIAFGNAPSILLRFVETVRWDWPRRGMVAENRRGAGASGENAEAGAQGLLEGYRHYRNGDALGFGSPSEAGRMDGGSAAGGIVGRAIGGIVEPVAGVAGVFGSAARCCGAVSVKDRAFSGDI